jgi:hypothetical protein
MKKLFLALALALLSAHFALAGESFSRGFELGFDQGFKHVRGEFSLPPVSPLPPIPPIGQDTFFGGYNAGFLQGIARAGG